MQNVNELRDRIIRAAECVTSEMLASTGEKLNVVLMSVMPLMVPVLSSTDHIRDFVRSNV